jgi:hypothetical protein
MVALRLVAAMSVLAVLLYGTIRTSGMPSHSSFNQAVGTSEKRVGKPDAQSGSGPKVN